MPRVRPPPARNPCECCKVKHVKCDNDGPSCRRCVVKDLRCVRLPKPTTFLPGSSARYDARFTGDETWVDWVNARRPARKDESSLLQSEGVAYPQSTPEPIEQLHSNVLEPQNTPHEAQVSSPCAVRHDEIIPRALQSPTNLSFTSGFIGEDIAQDQSPWTRLGRLEGSAGSPAAEPLDITQACLLKYFVDHIAPWFDTCDERKHFQMIVPVWARHFAPLLNAICATSSRHLSRLSAYAAPQGIQYEGQPLTNLTANTSVEYMLVCIPALRQFHESQDKEHRKLIVATAIVLRQFEEMEDEGNESSQDGFLDYNHDNHRQARVNFLDIINTIIRSSYDEGSFDRHELLDVAYWICLRQEVYSAFTQKRTPQMLLAPEQWANAATVNKMVMHAAQVAKWLFDDQSVEEWNRLNEQQALLEQNTSSQTRYMPFLRNPPNKTNGEVFPTLWYGSDLVVIGVQHVMIAKVVLIAEAPGLSVSQDRAAHRQAEAEVRRIILDLCGTATNRPSCPPALVNAIMGILLYGDFFTDEWERRALNSVIEMFQDTKAWPLPDALRSFA